MTEAFVYVSCAGSREIQVFSLNPATGKIHLRQKVPVSGKPSPLYLCADKCVLYVGTSLNDSVQALKIRSSDGQVTLIGSVAAPGDQTYVACDKSMRSLFSASYGGNCIAVFPLDSSGTPQTASQVEKMLPRAHATEVDLSNRWLLVPVLGEDTIRIYRIENNCRIVPNEPAMLGVRSGSGPRHLRFSRDNNYVYCLNELDGSIDVFDFDATRGTLLPKQSVTMLPAGFTGKPWAAELRTTPDNRFLYATDRRSSVIAAFAVDCGSGGLTLIDHYATEKQPRGMTIDPTGRWLLTAGQLSGNLAVYEIHTASGTLDLRDTCKTGGEPICIEAMSSSI